jgi:hypothetical protein
MVVENVCVVKVGGGSVLLFNIYITVLKWVVKDFMSGACIDVDDYVHAHNECHPKV